MTRCGLVLWTAVAAVMPGLCDQWAPKAGRSPSTVGARQPAWYAWVLIKGISVRRVLNVGGNNKSIPLPPVYQGWEHILLDIDPKGNPDVVCDARELLKLPPSEYDAVYCSHNLEHYYRHDVPKVLSGFLHVLKDDGFAHILVPDLGELMRTVVQRGLDIEDVLYQSPAGPITVRDVLFGWGAELERSGCEFFAHKTGFTQKSLVAVLERSGFAVVFSGCGNLEVLAYAFKNRPTEFATSLLNLPPID